jgi:hypothetical protein
MRMASPRRRNLSRSFSVSKNGSPRLLQRLNRAATQRRGDGRSFVIDDHAAGADSVYPSSKCGPSASCRGISDASASARLSRSEIARP